MHLTYRPTARQDERMTDATPEPTPADTARLDQIGAQLRDATPEQRAALEDAAQALQAAAAAGDDPHPAAGEVFAALAAAGVHTPGMPQPCPVCDGWGHDPWRVGQKCLACGGSSSAAEPSA